MVLHRALEPGTGSGRGIDALAGARANRLAAGRRGFLKATDEDGEAEGAGDQRPPGNVANQGRADWCHTVLRCGVQLACLRCAEGELRVLAPFIAGSSLRPPTNDVRGR